MNLEAIQSALREEKLDGWLFYDHHHRDPIAYRILGLSEALHVTRRWYYLIPADGEPRKLVHRIEAGRLDTLLGSKAVYSSWQELEEQLQTLLAPYTRLAMQYSPRNAIMYVSMVDAGTIELLRDIGKTIVSSSDLVSHFEAVLSQDQIASHYEAQRIIDEVLAEGFREVGRRVRPGNGGTSGVTEFAMVQWLSEAMRRGGLVWENAPDVAVNENTSDSHYAATEETTKPIRTGDFLLIDIWGRLNRPASIFYDITWTGVVGREPTNHERQVFETVRNGRDAAIALIQSSFAEQKSVAGWQADDAARNVIREAGFGDAFTHRTGHNITSEIHGNGAHLDNLETHDARLLLPFTCFSVEPGIYLSDFGVRSEINMVTSEDKAEVTGRVQTELLRI